MVLSENIVSALYIAASVLFILSLGGLSGQESAKRAVWYGIVGMAVAVIGTIFSPAVDISSSLLPLLVFGAVIGGIVMTGGFGTVLGIIIGAFIFGIAKEAFFYIPGIDGSFYRVFLGLVIIASALLNENIRKRIMGAI